MSSKTAKKSFFSFAKRTIFLFLFPKMKKSLIFYGFFIENYGIFFENVV